MVSIVHFSPVAPPVEHFAPVPDFRPLIGRKSSRSVGATARCPEVLHHPLKSYVPVMLLVESISAFCHWAPHCGQSPLRVNTGDMIASEYSGR
jgi:hypothetical protein